MRSISKIQQNGIKKVRDTGEWADEGLEDGYKYHCILLDRADRADNRMDFPDFP